MELASLLRAIVLYMSSISPDSSINNESSNSVVNKIDIIESSSPVITLISDKNISDTTNESDNTETLPYDCSMPYPPIDIDPPTADNANTTKSNETPELPHAKATFRIPLHIVHRLNDSCVLQLHR